MIVRAGHAHYFADAQHGADFLRYAAIFRRIIHRADRDDRALPDHQPGHGRHCPHGSGIGERNGGALEIPRRQLAGTGAADQIVKRGSVAGKVKRTGVLDVGDHQAASAAFGRDIDGNAEVDFLVKDPARFAVVFR